MELIQKNGVNTLDGWLQFLIQLSIFMAFYSEFIRRVTIGEHTFLWFQLGSRDPYFILPLIAAGATFLQQKLMMAGSPAADNPQMKVMLYFMPIMIGVFA